MAEIEPYKFREKTNLQEHNDIISKVNEVIDVINDVDMDRVNTRLTNDESQIAVNTAGIKSNSDAIASVDKKIDTEIATIDTKIDTEISKVDFRLDGHDSAIYNLREKDTALENAMPKTYTLYRDGTGKIKAQVETIDGSLMDSNTLDMIIPYQYDIVSGTTNRSFKLNITMSDGSSYTTNDFVIPEGGGSDISVTGITLSKDTSDVNRFHVGINLSDGTMIDSGFISMVDNVSGTFADNKLTITVNGVSSVPIEIDASGASYTAGTGIEISDGTISISDDVKKAFNSCEINVTGWETSSPSMDFSAVNGTKTTIDLSFIPALINLWPSLPLTLDNEMVTDYLTVEDVVLPYGYQPGALGTIIDNQHDIGVHYPTYTPIALKYYKTTYAYDINESGLNKIATYLFYESKLPDGQYIVSYNGHIMNDAESSIIGCIGVIFSDGEIIKASSNFSKALLKSNPNLKYALLSSKSIDFTQYISFYLGITSITVGNVY